MKKMMKVNILMIFELSDLEGNLDEGAISEWKGKNNLMSMIHQKRFFV